MVPDEELGGSRLDFIAAGLDQLNGRRRVAGGLGHTRALEELMASDSHRTAEAPAFEFIGEHPGQPPGAGRTDDVGVVDPDDQRVRGI